MLKVGTELMDHIGLNIYDNYILLDKIYMTTLCTNNEILQ